MHRWILTRLAAGSRGTVYVTLGRMEEKGYVESEPDPGAAGHLVLPRRICRPSAFGLFAIAHRAARRETNGWSLVRGMVLAVPTLVACYAAMHWSRWLVWAMVAPAWLGAWAPPVLFTGLALLVFRRRTAPREGGTADGIAESRA